LRLELFLKCERSLRRISSETGGLSKRVILSLPANACKTLFTLAQRYVVGDQMTETAPHKHCVVCGNAVGGDENFCDELCESKFKSAQRRQQLLFAAFIVLMALILFLPSLLKMIG
jgi:predicted nucleic acid-binding Zn ribbon protein